MSHAADTRLHSKGLKRADTKNKVQVELVQRDHLITNVCQQTAQHGTTLLISNADTLFDSQGAEGLPGLPGPPGPDGPPVSGLILT